MPYCQNCGTELTGSFCPNCGTQAGVHTSYNRGPIIHENADVKPRYGAGAMVLAGYLGFIFLMTALIVFIVFTINFLGGTLTFGEYFGALVGSVCVFAIAYLFYLPGIRSIRKRSPKGTAMKTFRSFFGKSLLFVLAWGITFMGCVYLFGIFFKVWRLGLWATRPNPDEYTAFVDGKKIAVIKCVDKTVYSDGVVRYIYKDANGEIYRPAFR